MGTRRGPVAPARAMVDAALTEGEEQWRTPRRAGAALVLVPYVAAVAVAATLLHRPLFRWLTREDGILEWTQFLADVVGLGAAVWVVTILWRRRVTVGVVLWGAFAAGLFFIAGEEISWGQRIFDVTTPEVLAERNHQNESNVHNIRVVQDSLNVVFMVAGLYGSIVAVALRRRLPRERRPAWFDLVVPPMILSSAFVLVFAYKLLRLVALESPRFTIVKYGEYIELCMACALAGFAVLTVRRLGVADPTTTDQRSAPTTIDLRDAPAPARRPESARPAP